MDEHSDRNHDQRKDQIRIRQRGEPGITLGHEPEPVDGRETPFGAPDAVPAGGVDPLAAAAAAFAAELTYRRADRGLSIRALAKAMGFDPSYVSHIESQRLAPTEEFARRADQALDAADIFWRRWLDYARARILTRPPRSLPPVHPPLALGQPTISPDTPLTSNAAPQAEAGDCSTAGPGHEVDLREAKGVQVGDNNTQHNTF
ncbi:helix-turn-helix domain-containing protein [Kitasatospora sp. NBC_01302]|uniref:helix-turn-helix domain-containing protein n=1 Tax=Kitasatospora sp. NBC_01302 TaxID=2903575 RepID=UPI002E14319F|nr:helix-turn-helix domain-containing protein [Kitasatospora sp. NBC_01302]